MVYRRTAARTRASFRSGLEEKTAQFLNSLGIPFTYEKLKLAYTRPQTTHVYTPDFQLPNGLIIETKGLFDTADRQKMKLIKAQHPGLDIRFVFSNAFAKIAKKSPTTYAKWAETNGFPWAHKEIPKAWLSEAQAPQ